MKNEYVKYFLESTFIKELVYFSCQKKLPTKSQASCLNIISVSTAWQFPQKVYYVLDLGTSNWEILHFPPPLMNSMEKRAP